MGNLFFDGPKILINASNLHVGGGVVVAISIIEELSHLSGQNDSISVIASDEVDSGLRAIGVDCSRFARYEIFNTYGLSALWSGLRRKLRGSDVVFTIFGPLYLWPVRSFSIVGFAQYWIVRPSNEVSRKMPPFLRARTRLKYLVQSLFFKLSDGLIVELDHVKAGLAERRLVNQERIYVVRNCLSYIYFQPERWKAIGSTVRKAQFSIGFLGRDYPHKNTDILPSVKFYLRSVHNIEVDFYVTFNASEWGGKSDLFRASVVNVGPLEVAQCPTFYSQMDAVIFPSLLECFSATPLEAMVMKKPLFASDRGFVRDVCGDFAWYFDPEEPSDVARVIAGYINNYEGRDEAELAAAREHVIGFSNARQRAEESLAIMQSALLKRPCI